MPFESPSRMMRYICQSLHGESSLIMIVLLIILMYYFIMDIILYVSLQNTNLFDQARDTSYVYSPFHPLSVKLLMTDPSSHYFICPVTEYFDHVTQFSKVFYFITPNMISFTHLFLGFVAARMVSSETLRTRRLAVILYEFRTCLDGFDGVVFRSHSGMQIYQSDRASFGYLVDGLCDIVAGIAFSFGCLFYQWKCPPVLKGSTNNEALPWTKNEIATGPAVEKHNHNQPARASRNHIFFKVLCFGTTLALAACTWDKTVDSYSAVLQTKMDNSVAAERQVEALHWTSTWFVMWSWRLLEGQSVLQMLLVSVFLDKFWGFMNLVQYLGFVILALLNLVSQLHLQMIRNYINEDVVTSP